MRKLFLVLLLASGLAGICGTSWASPPPSPTPIPAKRVPEPATVVLLISGALGLGVLRKWKS
jgi:hypothetical protein